MRVVVTGGGTVAPIDAVRVIANRSTGRFASELTEALLARGCAVWHVAAPGALEPFGRSARIDLDAVDPEREMERLRALQATYRHHRARLQVVRLMRGTVAEYAAVLRATLEEARADAVFLAMAVSDYEPEGVGGKIASNLDELVVRCTRTPKVIRSVRDWAPSAYVVAFKLLVGASAETLRLAGLESCRVNRADLCAANTLETVMAGRHEVLAVTAGGEVHHLGPEPPAAEGLADLALAGARAMRAEPNS
jgi:phosphopantothenate-cysteine ligase